MTETGGHYGTSGWKPHGAHNGGNGGGVTLHLPFDPRKIAGNRRLRMFLAVGVLVMCMQYLTPLWGGVGAMIGLGLFFLLMPARQTRARQIPTGRERGGRMQ